MNDTLHDLADTTIPESSQLTAQELYCRDYIIRIKAVKVLKGEKQSLEIFFHGDGGRPYKPCLTMRVIIVAAWGENSKVLIGRRLHLFRDPTAQWGGQEVGGIRVRRASHLKSTLYIPLRTKRKVITQYRLDPLPDDVPDTFPTEGALCAPVLDVEIVKVAAIEAARQGLGPLGEYWRSIKGPGQKLLQPHIEEIKRLAPDYAPVDVATVGEPENAS